MVSKTESIEGFPFEFEMGSILVQEMGSFTKGSKNPITRTNTPKSVEEVVAKALQIDKTTKIF